MQTPAAPIVCQAGQVAAGGVVVGLVTDSHGQQLSADI